MCVSLLTVLWVLSVCSWSRRALYMPAIMWHGMFMFLALACKITISIAGLYAASKTVSTENGLLCSLSPVQSAVCSTLTAYHDTSNAHVVSLMQNCLPAYVDLGPSAQEGLAPLLQQLFILHLSKPMLYHNTIYAMHVFYVSAGS